MATYKISRSELADIIAASTLKNGLTDKYIKEIAAYLVAQNRTKDIEPLMRDVQKSWIDSGYVDVIASSSRPLSSLVRSDIIKVIKEIFPSAKTVHITNEIDPSVIGGVNITTSDKQLNLSLKAKLDKFKQAAGGINS